MIRAYKYRIYPNAQQRELIEKHFGCTRFVYNWALDKKIKAYKETGKSPSRFDLSKMIPPLKKEHTWLKEVNAQSLISAIMNLDEAYKRYFKKGGGFPRYKKKKIAQSYQCPQSSKIDFDKSTLTVIKIPNIKVKYHRLFEGTVKTVTISRTASGRYYASILVDNGVPLPKPITPKYENSVGVDVGLTDFAVLSTGEKIDNPKYLKKSEKRLNRLQRQLSRKKKGSNNREKARRLVARQHEKVKLQRLDFLHNLSSRLIRENQSVVIEDLAVKNMVKNRRLAKAISDVGWHEFRRQLTYKAKWSGKEIVVIDRFAPSSKLCNACGYKSESMPLNIRKWECPDCGVKHDRDINAAINILNYGYAKIPGCDGEFTPMETM
jgi:putative transposase